MASNQEIGKRNKRNPGHCWQDNELYDVFQRVIGALAAHVFAQMTRWCYGHEVRMGLRELADEAGVSRSTAHRATLAMQALGMIRIREGRGRAAALYELLDLKEAARALGAQWDARRGSYTLNSTQILELRKRVDDALRCVPVRDANGIWQDDACVPVRDAKEEAENAGCVPVGDAKGCGNPPVVSQVVSQNRGVCVPNRGVPLISKDTKTLKTNLTPTPPRKTREGGEAPDCNLDTATEKLARELDVSDERQKRKLRSAIAQYAGKERMSPDEAAAAMIQAWREYREIDNEDLRFRWGPVKFITQGHWRNLENLPWEFKALRLRQQARIGAA